MNLLDHLDQWVTEHRTTLESAGSVKHGRTIDDRPKHSAYLSVETESKGVEILLWDSGEAELNYGTFDDSHFEHIEIDADTDLDAVLNRFMALVTE